MTTNVEFNAFAESSRLVERYIKTKYTGATRDEWRALAMDARDVMRRIANDANRIRASCRSAGGHGRFIQSQLDMNDKFRQKAEAVFENAIRNYNAA